MKNGMHRIRWRGVLLGTGMAVLVLVCGSAAAAGLMAKGVVGLEHMDLFAAGILAASALTGGLTALLGGGGPADAALTALGELVVLLALNAALNGGKMEGIPAALLVLAGGSGAAVLLRLGRSGGHGRVRRRRKNR